MYIVFLYEHYINRQFWQQINFGLIIQIILYMYFTVK